MSRVDAKGKGKGKGRSGDTSEAQGARRRETAPIHFLLCLITPTTNTCVMVCRAGVLNSKQGVCCFGVEGVSGILGITDGHIEVFILGRLECQEN